MYNALTQSLIRFSTRRHFDHNKYLFTERNVQVYTSLERSFLLRQYTESSYATT